jgi:GT2 family glycosyltransferase
MAEQQLPVTVIVRTVGRPALEACLASILACEPPAAEVLLVDQSGGPDVAALARRHAAAGVVAVASSERNRALAANLGLMCARHDIVLFTDDDCTVAPDWVAAGLAQMSAHPGALVTGRLMPAGDARAVPTYKTSMARENFTRQHRVVDLTAANLVCSRHDALALGGFDPAMVPAMEDWDFGYRWVRSGRPLFYEPGMVVWHHDWRTPSEMRRLWHAYGRGCGRFYAKLIRGRDPTVLVFLTRDVRRGTRAALGRLVLGDRGRYWDPRSGVLRGVPRGLVEGFRHRSRLVHRRL